MDGLACFGALDELIQIIYQGFDRFVVLSTVTDSSWTLSVGLKGPEGRWWRGSWSARDVAQFLGPEASSEMLKSFARNLAEAFVNGELCITDWVPDHGANMNLTLGPTSTKPVRVPLVELSAKEAASQATTILSGIALQARSRQCRLNPPAFSAQMAAGRSRDSPPKKKKRAAASPVRPRIVEEETEVARQKIRALEAELESVKAKKAKSKSPSTEVEPRPSTTRRVKGASLANPHKKARQYRQVEFESDNDEH